MRFQLSDIVPSAKIRSAESNCRKLDFETCDQFAIILDVRDSPPVKDFPTDRDREARTSVMNGKHYPNFRVCS